MKKLLLTSTAAVLFAGTASAVTVPALNTPLSGSTDVAFPQTFNFAPIVADPGFFIHEADLIVTVNWTVSGTVGPQDGGGQATVVTLLDVDVINGNFASLGGSLGASPGDGTAEFETFGTSGLVNVPEPPAAAQPVSYSLAPEASAMFSLNDNLAALADGESFDINTLTLTTAGLLGGGALVANLGTVATIEAEIEFSQKEIPSDIPLPAALPLLVSAIGGLGFLGWRNRRS